MIIESNMDKRKGHVATVLIHKGIIRVGDWIVAGTVIGRIKSMEDFLGNLVTEAIPSQPVQVVGWTSAPAIGKEFNSALSKDEAETKAGNNIDSTPLFEFFKGSPGHPGVWILMRHNHTGNATSNNLIHTRRRTAEVETRFQRDIKCRAPGPVAGFF